MDFGCILGALGVILGELLVVFWEHSGTYVGECWGMLGSVGCWGKCWGKILGECGVNAGGFWEMLGNAGGMLLSSSFSTMHASWSARAPK